MAADGTSVGEPGHLPQTLSLQYHFDTAGAFDPHVEAGLNGTSLFDEETSRSVGRHEPEAKRFCRSCRARGADFSVSNRISLNFDVRWLDINTDAELDGAALEEVEIDPIVYSLTAVWNF